MPLLIVLSLLALTGHIAVALVILILAIILG